MNIILIGFKCSGKSLIGKTLSLMLNRNYFDSDEIVKMLFFEKFQKRLSIFEIYNFLKEEKFRILENEAFYFLKDVKDSLISTGGGSILNKNNFKIFQYSKIIVYLKASKDTLKKRIQKEKITTQFNDERLFEKTFENRKDIYESFSDVTIQTDNKDIEEIALEIKNKIDLNNHLKIIKISQCKTKDLHV